MAKTIDQSASVKNSSIGEDSHVWKCTRIEDSTLDSACSVGDETIVVKSILGNKCEIGRRNIISNSHIGKGTSTQGNTTIRFAEVGKFCAIAWNVTIGAPNHEIHSLAIAENDYLFPDENKESLPSFHVKKCKIGNDVWVAAGAHVLRGVTIADGAVIAANAVVTKNAPPYAIVAGVPAKIIGYRFDEAIVNRLMKIQWWNLPQDTLNKCRDCFKDDLTNEKLDRLEAVIREQEK